MYNGPQNPRLCVSLRLVFCRGFPMRRAVGRPLDRDLIYRAMTRRQMNVNKTASH